MSCKRFESRASSFAWRGTIRAIHPPRQAVTPSFKSKRGLLFQIGFTSRSIYKNAPLFISNYGSTSSPTERRAFNRIYGILKKSLQLVVGLILASVINLRPSESWALSLVGPSSTDSSTQQYERAVQRHAPKSALPTEGEAALLLQMDKDLFTEDAWEGMKTILEVAKYVDSHMDAEGSTGCEECTKNREMLEKAWQIVANEYYDPQGKFLQAAWAKQLLKALQQSDGLFRTRIGTYTAVHDMVSTLGDKYTEFLAPAQFRKALRRPHPAERDYLERQYTGIGLQLGKHSSRGGWMVDGPLAESPSEEQGIQAGQRLLEIDGYPADLLTPLEIAALMRGPTGSNVKLTLAENLPHSKAWTVDLERRPLPQPPLKLGVLPGPRGLVQYIRVHYFSSETSRAFIDAIQEAELNDRRGVLIDLRNNPGGVFEEAISMASLLLRDGCKVAETVRNSDIIDNVFRTGNLSKEIFPNQLGQLTRLPIAILINQGTASASEVFAGALQDLERAVLVGQQTFGKGVVQHYFPFEDGSGLKVTVAKYLTPRRHDISQQGGIRPNISCSDYPHAGQLAAETDVCIAAALHSLR